MFHGLGKQPGRMLTRRLPEDPGGTPSTAARSLMSHGEVTRPFVHVHQVPAVLVGLPGQAPTIVGLKELTDQNVSARGLGRKGASCAVDV